MARKLTLIAALISCAVTTPAFAQDPVQEKPERIVLESKIGSVMGSTAGQGEYVTVNQGGQLVEGQSLMLSDGALATVVYYYANGSRKCAEKYEGPNTYIIDDSCNKAAYLSDENGSPMTSALIIVGAGVVGAAIIGSQDSEPVGPLSTGANGGARQF